MKHYKKFYEVGNNRYYTIVADNETYIGTESFLKVNKKKLFKKQEEISMGFKLLKLSSPIAQLFNVVDNAKPSKKQPYHDKDMICYNKISNKALKDAIKDAYTCVYEEELSSLKKQYKELTKEDKKDLAKQVNNYIKRIEKVDPMDGIDITSPEHTACNTIRTMLRDGYKHLYTERVNAFTNNVYLYDQDCFNTITIYRIITVKNVVKTIDTFIYDKELIKNLLKTLYEEGR